MSEQHIEVQTLPQVQDQETQMMQNLFQRAADTIVNASKLGREVNELRDQMKKLVDDANRMRDHIKWLEEENATLRTQRDESQNAHNADRQHWAIVEAGLNNQLEARQRAIDTTKYDIDVLRTAHGKALDEAKLWQEEASKLERERNGLVTERNYLKRLLENVWHGIKDHFTEPQAPKAEPEPTYANNLEEITAKSEQRNTLDSDGNPPYPKAQGHNSGDEDHKPYQEATDKHIPVPNF